jgi:hypothetical protein
MLDGVPPFSPGRPAPETPRSSLLVYERRMRNLIRVIIGASGGAIVHSALTSSLRAMENWTVLAPAMGREMYIRTFIVYPGVVVVVLLSLTVLLGIVAGVVGPRSLLRRAAAGHVGPYSSPPVVVMGAVIAVWFLIPMVVPFALKLILGTGEPWVNFDLVSQNVMVVAGALLWAGSSWRSRRHCCCARCWYPVADLSHTLPCPECGSSFDRPWGIRLGPPVRVAWMIAAGAVLMLAGAALSGLR